MAGIVAALALGGLLRAQTEPGESASHAALAPLVVVTGEGWQNTRGGDATGGWWNTLVDASLACRLDAWGGPPHSLLFVEGYWIRNRAGDRTFDASTTGAWNPSSSAFTGNAVRLYNVYYRQSWRDDTVSLKLGQVALDDDFMISDAAALYLHSVFGTLPSQSGTPLWTGAGHDVSFPQYALAAPGVVLKVAPPNRWSWLAAIADGRPGRDTPGNHGFGWSLSGHNGAIVFLETSRTYSLGGDAATVHLGGSYHSGEFDDFHALAHGTADARVRGLAAVYALHDVVLTATSAGKPRLTLYLGAGLSPQQDRSVVTVSYQAGLNWQGPIPGRARDTAGVAVAYTGFGDEYRILNGTGAAETTLELTYRAKLGAHFTVQPDAQWVFAAIRPTAAVVGLRGVWQY